MYEFNIGCNKKSMSNTTIKASNNNLPLFWLDLDYYPYFVEGTAYNDDFEAFIGSAINVTNMHQKFKHFSEIEEIFWESLVPREKAFQGKRCIWWQT